MTLANFNKSRIKAIISQSWAVGWPMTLIMFFQFLIGLTDVYVAGRFGKEVQAAYGVAFQLYFIFVIIGIALTVGSVSVASRLFTSTKKEELEVALNSSFISSAAMGILFSITGIILSKNIIQALSIPQEIKGPAGLLLRTYSIGFIFDYILLNTNGALRACKMIKKSLCTAALVCVLNICLALTIPFKTSFGYSGIAIATVISLFIGAIFNIFYVTKLFIPKFSFSFPLIKKIMNISWPFGLLQIIWQLASMVLFFILNALPKNNIEVIAAFTNGLKIESAIFLPAFAFNMANSVIVGNFIGEKKKKDAYHAGIVTAFIGVLIVLFLTLMVMFNAKRIAAFLSDNSTVVRESMKYIYISLMFEPFMAWGIILGGGLNGAGDTRSVMLAVALSLWCIRIPLAFLLGVHTTLGAIGVWWAMNASIFAQTAFISWRYLAKKWLVSAQQLLSE